LLGLLDGSFDGSLLVVLGIVAKFARDRDWFSHFGVHEVAMISFASAIHKASSFKVSDEFSNFSWHPLRIVSGILKLPIDQADAAASDQCGEA
jgi:hypothetical protein